SLFPDADATEPIIRTVRTRAYPRNLEADVHERRNRDAGALIVEGAIAYAVGALLALHALRRDCAVPHRFLSEYAIGPFGLVMTTVFAVLGGAVLLLAARLRAVRPALAVATGACGVALLTLAAFPTDLNDGSAKTAQGTVHDLVSLGMFVVVMG